MPTDNPKISLYVPQQIYDRFKLFQEEQSLSMSQAGIVILAEYFGLKETIKEITEGTTVGGVTLAEFEQLKQRIEQLENQVDQAETTSKLSNLEEKSISKDTASHTTQSVLELSSETAMKPMAGLLLGKRLGVSKNMPAGYKRKHTVDEFALWSEEKDPDRIAWIPNPNGKGYLPKSKLSRELLSKLQKWISNNL